MQVKIQSVSQSVSQLTVECRFEKTRAENNTRKLGFTHAPPCCHILVTFIYSLRLLAQNNCTKVCLKMREGGGEKESVTERARERVCVQGERERERGDRKGEYLKVGGYV